MSRSQPEATSRRSDGDRAVPGVPWTTRWAERGRVLGGPFGKAAAWELPPGCMQDPGQAAGLGVATGPFRSPLFARSVLYFYFLFFWPRRSACGILVS